MQKTTRTLEKNYKQLQNSNF